MADGEERGLIIIFLYMVLQNRDRDICCLRTMNQLTEDNINDKLIDKVIVYAEGRIEVVWKFGDNVKMLNIGKSFLVCTEWYFGTDQF